MKLPHDSWRYVQWSDVGCRATEIQNPQQRNQYEKPFHEPQRDTFLLFHSWRCHTSSIPASIYCYCLFLPLLRKKFQPLSLSPKEIGYRKGIIKEQSLSRKGRLIIISKALQQTQCHQLIFPNKTNPY